MGRLFETHAHLFGDLTYHTDVFERQPGADPELVLKDIRDEMITEGVARRVYGLVIDAERGCVDAARTARRRATMRRDRLKKGRKFGAFVKEWRQRRPPDHIIRFYGHWPEPRVAAYDKPFWGIYN